MYIKKKKRRGKHSCFWVRMCVCVRERKRAVYCTCARRRRYRHRTNTTEPPRRVSMLRWRLPDFHLCLWCLVTPTNLFVFHMRGTCTGEQQNLRLHECFTQEEQTPFRATVVGSMKRQECWRNWVSLSPRLKRKDWVVAGLLSEYCLQLQTRTVECPSCCNFDHSVAQHIGQEKAQSSA